MANVTRGARTTETAKAKAEKPALTVLQEKVKKELDVEQPVVFISTLGKDGAWIKPPNPLHDASNGHYIGMEPGVYLRFTNGISDPFYLSKPEHARAVKVIRDTIEQGWQVVEDLGLEEVKAGDPLPPLKKWDTADLETIKVALEANFGDDFAENERKLEQGVRYELSKKQPRKDVLQLLEGLRLSAAAEAGDADALDVEV